MDWRAHLQGGDLVGAENALLRAILECPSEFKFYGNLSAVRRQADAAFARTLDILGKALILAPGEAGLHHNLGNLLFLNGGGDLLASYCRSLVLQPALSESYRKTGLVRQGLDEAGAAARLFNQAGQCTQERAKAALCFAQTAALSGRDDAVLRHLGQARIHPPNPLYREKITLAAKTLVHLGRADEAERYLEDSVAEAGDNLALIPQIAGLARRLKFFRISQDCARRELLSRPRDYRVYIQYAGELSEEAEEDVSEGEEAHSGEDRAARLLRQALMISPAFAPAINNSAILHEKAGRWRESEETYRRAVIINPHKASLLSNAGLAAKQNGKLDKAVTSYLRAMILGPEDSSCAYNLILAQLARGDRDLDLGPYEYRWSSAATSSPRRGGDTPSFTKPEWQGEPLEGRSLLIWGEQGLGDEVWFSGYIPRLAETVLKANPAPNPGQDAAGMKKSVVECDPRFAPLLRRSLEKYGSFRVIGRQEAHDSRLDEPDLQCAMGSLPYRLSQTGSLPAPASSGYLQANPGRVNYFRQRHSRPGTRLVGISWRSVKPSTSKLVRSYEAVLSAWLPLLNRPDLTFVSLQYGPVEDEIERIHEQIGRPVIEQPNIDPHAHIDDLAALISATDLVVSIANVTAALANGLGKETLLALRSVQGDWRYTQGHSMSEWLPKVRMFWPEASESPESDDSWDDVLRAISDHIAVIG